jgi:unsaturated rhamnogalacturonyl hydrolase
MGDRECVILMAKGAIVEKAADGRLAAIGGGATDSAMGGTAYWRAGELTGDPEMQEAARGLLEFVLKRTPRAADGTCYHVFNSPEMWSDSFYTTPPFLAATAHYDEAMRQIEGLRKRLWIAENKLLSHIWDDGRHEFRDQAFWGVGNGWAAAGLTRVMAAMPAERRAERERLSAFLKELLDGCLAHQRPDGLFHNVLDRPTTFVETNLAQMLAFSIYTGVLSGWLSFSSTRCVPLYSDSCEFTRNREFRHFCVAHPLPCADAARQTPCGNLGIPYNGADQVSPAHMHRAGPAGRSELARPRPSRG